MKRRARSGDIFSMSLLDVVSCGFGAMVLLLLITESGVTESDVNEDLSALLGRTFQTEDSMRALSEELERLQRELAANRSANQDALAAHDARRQELERRQAEAEILQDEGRGLETVRQALQRAQTSRATASERDTEVGGIPVDSDYVIFIIDTSGSMQSIWDKVIRTIENILDVHPEVRGFQILNDNGFYLVGGYRGRWIPDTPKRRKSILNAVRSWGAVSNSSPVEGLEVALKAYAGKRKKISIYIFGDDFSGSSYDTVIRTVEKLNTDKTSGAPIVRVHAIGFSAGGVPERFGTLMREVTAKNNGVFLALPP